MHKRAYKYPESCGARYKATNCGVYGSLFIAVNFEKYSFHEDARE